MKRLFVCAALICSAFLGAQTYSVQVFEEGVAAEGESFPVAQDILSSCLDEFFMSGRVATSQVPAKASVKDFEAFSEAEAAALEEAYITHVLRIYYALRPPKKGMPPIPSKISYRFIRIDGRKLLAKGSLAGMEYPLKTGEAEADAKKFYESAGAGIVGACLEADK